MKHTLSYCQKVFPDYVIAAYFFNARGNQLEKTPLGMMRSLLYQLLDKDSLLCDRFIPMFLDKQKKHGREWEWQLRELEDFLRSESENARLKPLLLLVDALDECNEPEARRVVEFLESLSINAVKAKTSLNICLSSRHYPTIRMGKALELTVESKEGHDRDIVLYIQGKLRVDDKKIQQNLCERANGVFMWVILVVGMLNKAYDDGDITAMEKKLHNLPSDLEKIFSTLLNEHEDQGSKQKTILMLQWVLFARRLLSPKELYFAVLAGTAPDELRAWNRLKHTPDIIRRFITSTSKGLIEIRKGHQESVQFIHESVNDFLLRNQRLQTLDSTLEPHVIGASHDRLKDCCMSYIMMRDFEPVVERVSRLNEAQSFDFDVRELRDNYPFLVYASKYVLYHAEKAQEGCVWQENFVQQLQQQPHREFERLRIFRDWFTPDVVRKFGGSSALLYAISFYGYAKLVQISLLENGPNVNARGGYYGNALQAASARDSKATVELLLENGADVNVQGGFYGNALQAASVKGSKAIVELLLEKGADVSLQGGLYGNALQAASVNGSKAIIELLLEKEADVNVQGGYYGNALQAASVGGSKAIVELLLDKGANVNVQGGYYGNALQAASTRSNDKIVELLLEKKADVNAQGGFYGNALQAASVNGSKAIMELLLEKGADVNVQGGFYGNALQAASVDGSKAIVELLLEKGANVNVQGGYYGNALQAASAGDNDKIVELLQEKGAKVNAQ